MSSGLLFRKSDGFLFKLDSAVVTTMQSYLQLFPSDLEAGGVMMGRQLRNQPHLIVDEVTVPMPGDRRARTRFSRAQTAHQRVLDESWELSRGTCSYLGEWHTHPEPSPTPSQIDLRNWRKHLRVDEYDGDCLYFVIVGMKEFRVWEGRRADLQFVLLPATSPG